MSSRSAHHQIPCYRGRCSGGPERDFTPYPPADQQSDFYARPTHRPTKATQVFQIPGTIGFHWHQTLTNGSRAMGANAEQTIKRTIRRTELRQIVPVADTTIYEMEQRGEFPRRFNLTPRCVVWDLAEVEAWISERRLASDTAVNKRAPAPDVRQRKTRPVRA